MTTLHYGSASETYVSDGIVPAPPGAVVNAQGFYMTGLRHAYIPLHPDQLTVCGLPLASMMMPVGPPWDESGTWPDECSECAANLV